ncbi:hypothetical protein V5F77_22485, partial [Xanthobacter sp. DSM 24535]|uniref:hypothetical protein n=1 Tax=Roseixanthobacter psychrophilus TaxID=3119917 RepID=UPI00372C9219
STLVVMAASTAFAGPYVGPENEQQYIVSGQETLVPHAAKLPQVNAAPAANFDAHSGPAFDPDVD